MYIHGIKKSTFEMISTWAKLQENDKCNKVTNYLNN